MFPGGYDTPGTAGRHIRAQIILRTTERSRDCSSPASTENYESRRRPTAPRILPSSTLGNEWSCWTSRPGTARSRYALLTGMRAVDSRMFWRSASFFSRNALSSGTQTLLAVMPFTASAGADGPRSSEALVSVFEVGDKANLSCQTRHTGPKIVWAIQCPRSGILAWKMAALRGNYSEAHSTLCVVGLTRS